MTAWQSVALAFDTLVAGAVAMLLGRFGLLVWQIKHLDKPSRRLTRKMRGELWTLHHKRPGGDR